MSNISFHIFPQTDADNAEVETLLDTAFGIDRRTKTSYRLREGETALPGLSFVARDDDGKIIGTISFWQVHIGKTGPDTILLGPLAVMPGNQASGIGQALMKHAIAVARKTRHQMIVLVGDGPYYAKVGFKQIPVGQVIMPGPNDPERLLYLELQEGVINSANGLIRSPSRYRTAPFRSKPGSR
ncbi:MAG TPA: N-acetyltransferase [Rhizobiales bacterium]|nr:N-acetyltransferase [Hyphomicrobiales bacterium]